MTSNIVANYSYPLNQPYKNANPNLNLKSGDRVWYSNPRVESDNTWEVLTVSLRKPLIVTDLTFSLLSKAQFYKFYYVGIDGSRAELYDVNRVPVEGNILQNDVKAWTDITKNLNSVQITQLEIRVKRNNTRSNSTLFSLGVKNVLLKRSVSAQSDTIYSLDTTVDAYGNSIRLAVQDWRPELAVDNSSYTFWKSEPQGSPHAVVNFYASLGGDATKPQRLDRFWIDPVYTGQTMNMYYSVDPTVGVIKPRPTNRSFFLNTGVTWNRGISLNSYDCGYSIVTGVLLSTNGTNTPIIGNTGWIGGEWEVLLSNYTYTPGTNTFATFSYNGSTGTSVSTSGITAATLKSALESVSTIGVGNVSVVAAGGGFTIALRKVQAGTLTINATGTYTFGVSTNQAIFTGGPTPGLFLNYNNSTKTFRFSTYLTNSLSFVDSAVVNLSNGSRVQYVCVAYTDPATKRIFLRLIVAVGGIVVSDTTADPSGGGEGIGQIYRYNGYITFGINSGYLRNFVIKVLPEADSVYLSFINDPTSFLQSYALDPKNAPSILAKKNLDNAIFVGRYAAGETGYGGAGIELFTEKQWTPVWKDWVCQRGFYYLPAPVAACYVKLEFSQLTEQPYTLHETGLTTSFQTFPLQAKQSSQISIPKKVGVSATSASGALQRANFKDPNAYQRVNNPSTVTLLTPKTTIINTSRIITGLRNQVVFNAQTSSALVNEKALNTSLRGAATNDTRDLTSAVTQVYSAGNSAANLIPKTGNALSPIDVANGLSTYPLNDSTSSSSLGSRVPGWWILPGAQLKVPQAVMDSITNTSTVTEKPAVSSDQSTLRPRFPTVSVHRYDLQTVTRDVGLAYFAGLRGFQPYSIDYTVLVDSDQFIILSYSENSSASANVALNKAGSAIPSSPSIAGARPSQSALTSAGGAQITTTTCKSIGTFIKVAITTIDRGLHSYAQGSAITAIGDSSNTAFWNSDTVNWADTNNYWGSSTALVSADLSSNVSYAGKQAYKVYRGSTPASTSATVKTVLFSEVIKAKTRIRANIFRTAATNNVLTVSIVDTTPSGPGVLKSFPLNPTIGQWVEFSSDFYSFLTDYSNSAVLNIQLSITGPDEETLYLSDLYDESTSILYFLSNDNGSNYYEATEVVNAQNSFFDFPTPGNQLKAKLVMYDALDYAYGMTITPVYLF